MKIKDPYKCREKISFFRSKHDPKKYLLYKGLSAYDVNILSKRMNHEGPEGNKTGYPKIDVEFVKTVGYENIYYGMWMFLDFIASKIATEHTKIPFYDCDSCKAWCIIENFEPEKWENDFLQY